MRDSVESQLAVVDTHESSKLLLTHFFQLGVLIFDLPVAAVEMLLDLSAILNSQPKKRHDPAPTVVLKKVFNNLNLKSWGQIIPFRVRRWWRLVKAEVSPDISILPLKEGDILVDIPLHFRHHRSG